MRRWICYGVLVLALVFPRVTINLVAPFVLALILAAMLNPVVGWLVQKTPLGRSGATAAVFLLGGLLGSGILILATAALVQGIALFLDTLPAYRKTVTGLVEEIIGQVGAFYLRIPPDVIDVVKRSIDEVLMASQRLLTSLGQAVVVALGSLPAFATVLLIALLAAFFITKDWDWFMGSLRELLPEEWRPSASRAGSELGASLGRYVLAQAIVIAISTSISTLGLLIIGVDRWLAAGLIGGLLDVVPIVGPALMYVPWAIYSWVVGQRGLALSLVALYGGVSALRQIVEPKVVGESLGIHPLIMLAGLYWGGTLLGAKGLLIAPLLLIFLKALLRARQEAAAGSDEASSGF